MQQSQAKRTCTLEFVVALAVENSTEVLISEIKVVHPFIQCGSCILAQSGSGSMHKKLLIRHFFKGLKIKLKVKIVLKVPSNNSKVSRSRSRIISLAGAGARGALNFLSFLLLHFKAKGKEQGTHHFAFLEPDPEPLQK
jgi:hypothetical protein